jgi:hypothetical protein
MGHGRRLTIMKESQKRLHKLTQRTTYCYYYNQFDGTDYHPFIFERWMKVAALLLSLSAHAVGQFGNHHGSFLVKGTRVVVAQTGNVLEKEEFDAAAFFED